MAEKTPSGLVTHDGSLAQESPADSTGDAERRQAGALNIVENPLMLRYTLWPLCTI